MSIDRDNLSNQVENLFTVSNGMTSWWELRLLASIKGGGGGATATIKVNGEEIPDRLGGFAVGVDPTSFPRRTGSCHCLLNDGDVVSVDVQGPSSVDIKLSGEVCSEQL